MANEEQRQAWAVQGQDWVEHAAIFEAVLAPYAAAVLDAADLRPGQRVLDVGCGTGALLTGATEAGAQVTGVDVAEPMVAEARRRVPEAQVLLADAQTADLRGDGPAFDRVISRFGVMFFDDPVAAFANIRAAAAPGARLAFVCWRAGENPMFSVGADVLAARLADPPPAPDPAAPGPMAFGDPDRVHAILADAGWAQVALVAFDGACRFSVAGSDGVEERVTMLLGNRTGRQAAAELPETLGPDGWAAVLDEVRAELRRHLVDGALQLPGPAWVVTAVNPA